MSDLLHKITAEARRIEEDTEHSAKGHFNASDRWGRYHLWLGIPAAVLAATAGGTAFTELPEVSGSLAMLATALTTVLTFLKPSEHAENHKTVGGYYLELRNRTRLFRELELGDNIELDIAKKRILEFSKTRDELNHSSPGIPRKDYEKAKADIDSGRNRHVVDTEEA